MRFIRRSFDERVQFLPFSAIKLDDTKKGLRDLHLIHVICSMPSRQCEKPVSAAPISGTVAIFFKVGGYLQVLSIHHPPDLVPTLLLYKGIN